VRSVVIFNELLFEGDSYVAYPNNSTNQISIPIKTEKN